MNISATRKVSGSSGSSKRVTRPGINEVSYSAAAQEQHVETIDASNKVSVNVDSRGRDHEEEYHHAPQHPPVQEDISSGRSLIKGSLETLNTAEIQEEASPSQNRNQKINVYGANQNLYDKEENAELDKFYNENYVKHLYENNTPPDDIDELI